MINSSDISMLRDDVEYNCRQFIKECNKNGLNVLVTQTVRDNEYQAMLYAQGRTTAGSIITKSKVATFHNVLCGLAFDICKNVKGHEYDDIAFFKKCGNIAKKMGFSWGGDWTAFRDMPHIQWDNYGRWTSSAIKSGSYPPKMPKWESEDEMTQTQFNSMMDKYLEEKGKEIPSAWSANARSWAEKNGIVKGDEKGNKKYRNPVTKEELVQMLFNMQK